MRFRCVCKSWSSLTRDPSFVSAHQNLGCNRNTHLLLTAWDKPTTQQHFFLLGNQPTRKFNTRPSSKPSNAANQE
ncbi:unnamed protein product [Prunus armeniaca]|uniref:F-box domain-containing protein n=1 Tax=Prunus armeniaca TaxID=36596 RepID=A0A6J5V157_PRUAR|nr:unnamed protein product [Prunus armeniaca]